MTEVDRSSGVLDHLDSLVPYLVGKGAGVLDLHGPEGWRQLVKAADLNMYDGERCVLGQIYAAEYREVKRAYDAEFPVPPIGHVGPGSNGYHYGAQKLTRLSGMDANGVTWSEFVKVCGFLPCNAPDACEVTTLSRHSFITGEMLKAAWLIELAR